MHDGRKPLLLPPRKIKGVETSIPEAFRYQYAVPPGKYHGDHDVLRLPTSGGSFLDAVVNAKYDLQTFANISSPICDI